MFAISPNLTEQRKSFPLKISPILFMAIGIVAFPLAGLCQANTCYDLGAAACQLTANTASAEASDAATMASIANEIWANLAIANCNGNQACIAGIDAQAQANADAIGEAWQAAIDLITQAFNACIQGVIAICGSPGA